MSETALPDAKTVADWVADEVDVDADGKRTPRTYPVRVAFRDGAEAGAREAYGQVRAVLAGEIRSWEANATAKRVLGEFMARVPDVAVTKRLPIVNPATVGCLWGDHPASADPPCCAEQEAAAKGLLP